MPVTSLKQTINHSCCYYIRTADWTLYAFWGVCAHKFAPFVRENDRAQDGIAVSRERSV